jgi:hypothetical protein
MAHLNTRLSNVDRCFNNTEETDAIGAVGIRVRVSGIYARLGSAAPVVSAAATA